MRGFGIFMVVVLLFLLGVPGCTLMYGVGKNNSLVQYEQDVKQTTAEVQNQLQRQADLIPNLVAVVKQQAKFEGDTFTRIIEAGSRASAMAKVDPVKLANDPELQKSFVAAMTAIQPASLINMVREAYPQLPQLQSNASFRALMSQLEGAQNRVTVARGRNQRAVETFNSTVLKFPVPFIQGLGYMVQFKEKPYFQAEETAQKAPKVEF